MVQNTQFELFSQNTPVDCLKSEVRTHRMNRLVERIVGWDHPRLNRILAEKNRNFDPTDGRHYSYNRQALVRKTDYEY